MKKIYTFLFISTLCFASCGEKKTDTKENSSQDTTNQVDTNSKNIPPAKDTTKLPSVVVDSSAKNAGVTQKEERKVEAKSKAKNPKNKVGKGVCPICTQKDLVIPVLYGRPNNELQEKQRKGSVKLAGCVYQEGMPHFYCKRDKKGFL